MLYATNRLWLWDLKTALPSTPTQLVCLVHKEAQCWPCITQKKACLRGFVVELGKHGVMFFVFIVGHKNVFVKSMFVWKERTGKEACLSCWYKKMISAWVYPYISGGFLHGGGMLKTPMLKTPPPPSTVFPIQNPDCVTAHVYIWPRIALRKSNTCIHSTQYSCRKIIKASQMTTTVTNVNYCKS